MSVVIKRNKFLKKKIGYSSIVKFEFLLFIFFALFMPRDSFNIKITLLIILLLTNIKVVIEFFIKKKNLYYLFYIIFFPIILFLLSIIQTKNLENTIGFYYVFIYLLVIPIVEEYNINFRKIIMMVLAFLSLIIVLGAVLDFLSIIDINNNSLLQFLSINKEAQISKSPNALFYYVIFLNASPLIIILFCYALSEKRLLLTALSFSALLFSGTRANIYLSFAILVLYVFFFFRSKLAKLFSILVGLFILNKNWLAIVEKITRINLAKNTGDQIRKNNLSSIFDSMKDNPINYIIGNGARSEYYSAGRNAYIMESELSYAELFRQAGIIGVVPFVIFLVKPIWLIYRNKMYWLVIGYVGYLLVSVIDPFLFTSTSFILYSYVYCEYRSLGRLN